MKDLFSCIEAAAKRDSDHLHGVAQMVGNAAKIHDAMKALVEYWNWGGYDAMRRTRLQDSARAALAAPPRNCDNHPNFMKALTAFMEERKIYAFSAVEWEEFARWLFEEAKINKPE